MVSSRRNDGTITQELRYPFAGTAVQFRQVSSILTQIKKFLFASLIVIVATTSMLIMTEDADAASIPKKCPKCGAPSYQYVYQYSYPKEQVKRITVWKKVGAPVKNDSGKARNMGFYKGESSTIKYDVNGSISWGVLKFGGSYTQSSTKTTGFYIGDRVPSGKWCNLYLAHTIDVYKIYMKTERKCAKCKYVYTTTNKLVDSCAWIPVRTNGVKSKFLIGTKNEVNKTYLY